MSCDNRKGTKNITSVGTQTLFINLPAEKEVSSFNALENIDFPNNRGNVFEECNYHDNALFPKLEPLRSQVNLTAKYQPIVFLLGCYKNRLISITADIEGIPSNPVPNITADRTNITLDHT